MKGIRIGRRKLPLIPLVPIALFSGSVIAQESTLKTLILTQNSTGRRSTIMLYDYNAGNPLQIWTAKTAGIVGGLAFCDLESDGNPEVVVSTYPGRDQYAMYGTWSFLVYRNVSGTYELIFNKTAQSWNNLPDYVRAHIIDYYDNGTYFLIGVLGTRLVLVRYEHGKVTMQETLPYGVSPYGLDVGDVNNDGKPDIVCSALWDHTSRLNIIENHGGGQYTSRLGVGFLPYPNDGIVIGDVDGDGLNEITVVGTSRNGEALQVHKNIGGEYKAIWSHNISCYGSIQSVDIGDVDGDGLNEIATAAKLCEEPPPGKLSIWKYNKSSGSFFLLWEDNGRWGANIKDMLCLRIVPLEEEDEPKVVGMDRGWLYVVDRRESGYETRIVNLFWYIGTVVSQGLDVWSVAVPVDELGAEFFLVMSIAGAKMLRRETNE